MQPTENERPATAHSMDPPSGNTVEPHQIRQANLSGAGTTIVTPVYNQPTAPPAQAPANPQFRPDSDHEMGSQPEQGGQPTQHSQMNVEPMVQIDRNKLTQQWIAENAGGAGKVRTVSRTREYTRQTKTRQIQKSRRGSRITKPIVIAHQNKTNTRHRTGTARQQPEPAYTGTAGPVQPIMPAPLQPQAGAPPPHHPTVGPVQ